MEERTLDFQSMTETKDDFSASDFDHTGLDANGVKADMALIEGLADEKDLAMLNRDEGGFQLGNSRTVLRHVQEAAKRIRTMIDGRTSGAGLYKSNGLTDQQRRQLEGDARTLLKRALMQGRAEFIRRSGKTLNGY